MKYETKFRVPINKILIVHARFNQMVVNSLLTGAQDYLKKHDLKEEQLDSLEVPGSYEIPLAVNSFCNKERYDGIIVLGCIIEGETQHHELIISHLNTHLGKISLEKNIPIGMGILTTQNLNQALERAGNKMGNKGWEAAATVLEMISLMQSK